jgi:hypothetical protein
MRSNDDSYSASTQLAIIENLNTRWNYSLDISRRYSNAINLTRTTVFPDVDLTLSGVNEYLQALFHADEENWAIKTASLSSGVTYTNRLTCRNTWNNKEKEAVTLSLSPLLGCDLTWAFNLDTAFSYGMETSTETTIRAESGNLVRSSDSQTFSTDFTHHLNAARGIKIPFLGTMRFKNEFTTDFSLDYSRSKVDNKNEGTGVVQSEKNERKLDAELGGTYNFHRNVTGGTRINWSRTTNLKRDEITTTFGLSIWVQIEF